MARARISIRRLANEAGMDVDEALLQLMENGFSFNAPEDVIPKSALARVRRTLKLPAKPPSKSRVDCDDLAKRAGFTYEETEAKLLRAGILTKGKQRTFPRAVLRRAEIAVGIRGASAGIHPERPEDPVSSETSAAPTGPAVPPRKKKRSVST